MDIASVLIIPDKEHLHLLEKKGSCGATPPIAHDFQRQFTPHWISSEVRMRGRPNRRALVLAWEGEVDLDGCARFARAFSGAEEQEMVSHVRQLLENPHTLRATFAEAWSVGTLLWVNSSGIELG